MAGIKSEEDNMNEVIRVGLIGLGEVAQTVHLPVLHTLKDKFSITGICDISQQLLDAFGKLPGLKICSNDYKQIVESPDIDVVFVLNSDEYHTETAVAALKAGKDIFVEKPLGLSIPDVERLKLIQKESGTLVFVGYMRRFAPAFLALKNDLPNLGKPLYIKLRDIIGPNRYFVKQGHAVIYPDDISEKSKTERAEKESVFVNEAVGDVGDEFKAAYLLLCGLGVHDLSLVRELFGLPRSIQSAEIWQKGNFIRATLDYGDFKVGYETGVDKHGRFDALVEVIGEDGIGTVCYDTPYLRNLPIRYEQKITSGDEFKVKEIRPTYIDPYTMELQQLYEHIRKRIEPKTNIEDSIEDLKLCKAIINAAKTGKETSL
jgi:predicted dehydrogenase